MTVKLIRDVKLGDFRLQLFNTGSRLNVGYSFFDKETVIFEGEDYKPSAKNSIDSDESVLDLFSHLSKTPDEHEDLFDRYNDNQLEWAQKRARELADVLFELDCGEWELVDLV